MAFGEEKGKKKLYKMGEYYHLVQAIFASAIEVLRQKGHVRFVSWTGGAVR